MVKNGFASRGQRAYPFGSVQVLNRIKKRNDTK